MLFRDTVEFTHMTLGLVPEVLDTVDMVSTLGKEFRMVDPEVFERANVQRVIAPPTIRIHDAVWCHFALDNRHKRLARGVWDDPRVNFSALLI